MLTFARRENDIAAEEGPARHWGPVDIYDCVGSARLKGLQCHLTRSARRMTGDLADHTGLSTPTVALRSLSPRLMGMSRLRCVQHTVLSPTRRGEATTGDSSGGVGGLREVIKREQSRCLCASASGETSGTAWREFRSANLTQTRSGTQVGGSFVYSVVSFVRPRVGSG